MRSWRRAALLRAAAAQRPAQQHCCAGRCAAWHCACRYAIDASLLPPDLVSVLVRLEPDAVGRRFVQSCEKVGAASAVGAPGA
jgi:hypothetical protein